MKVAFVSNGLSSGGSERTTVNLANGLNSFLDIDVSVITGEIKENEYSLNSNIKRYPLLKKNIIKDSWTIQKIVKQQGLDVVVGMGIFDNFCVCIASFFSKAKMIISERNDPEHDRLSWKSKLLRTLLYPTVDAYVFQTEGAKSFYNKRIQKHGVVIHNPVRDDLPLRSINPKKEIVAFGRLEKQKNCGMLIKAFSKVHLQYPEYRLRIYGQGSEEEHLKQIVANLKLQSVVLFEGFNLSVHDSIKDSDIFVLSSNYEGMPNSLMEAMAMGFPVVSTDCPSGGPRELIENHKNGVLVNVNDSDEMANEIINLIRCDKLKSEIGQNALQIRQTHSIISICSEWRKLFKSIVGLT